MLRSDESLKTAGAEKNGESSVGLVSLDAAVQPGDSVYIVWRSSDGSTWKRVFDESLKVRELSGEIAHVTVTAEQAHAIEAAKSDGRVFVAPL